MSGATGRVIVVSGPSGVGKTTLVRRLFSGGAPGFVRSVSATTRAPRPGEEDGKDYFFLSEEEFLAREKRGEFLETATVFGRRYGTPRRPVEEALRAGRSVILEIDVQGAESVRKSGLPSLFVFVDTPSIRALENRLRRRGSNPEERARRLKEAERERRERVRFDAVVVNDDLKTALEELRRILGLGPSGDRKVPAQANHRKGQAHGERETRPVD